MIARAAEAALALVLVLALTGCRDAARPEHILWLLHGETNSVYLLGSVHVLRDQDYPLPAAFEAAYADAERLVMELDMDEIDPVTMTRTMLDAGLISNGGTLQSWLGEAIWQQALAAAQPLDIDLDLLQRTEPWFAALTIVENELMRLGYNPLQGVEMYYAARARADSKPVDGLETLEQQVNLFDGLPIETQRLFLLKAIEDASVLKASMDTLIEAWKRGDAAALETELVDSFAEFPLVYRSVVAERNRQWIGQIEALLDEPQDYLVIVGALHLIGEDSVVQLLRRRGHRIERL